MNATGTSNPRVTDMDVPELRRRATASTITDPDLDTLYDERDRLLRLVLLLAIAGAAA